MAQAGAGFVRRSSGSKSRLSKVIDTLSSKGKKAWPTLVWL